MKDLTKIYIDLRKCTEEQRKHIFSLLPKNRYSTQYGINEHHFILHHDDYDWWVVGTQPPIFKTELTYPEFIKLFEGGDGENNGWIKIKSEADLPKEGMMNYFICVDAKPSIHPVNLRLLLSLYNDGMVSHYQKIQLPEPPKF